MEDDILVTGAAWDRATAAWPDPNALHDEPDSVCAALVHAVEWAAAVARRAWLGSGQSDPDPARVGCVLGTLYGNDYVSEYVAGVLSARGARWLNPEAFGFAAPHATTAAICIELGIGGAAFTLVGATCGLTAVARGASALALGQHDIMLCGAYDWPSPRAGRLYQALDVPYTAGRRSAAFLVLETGRHAADRGARRLGTLLGWADRRSDPSGRGDPGAVGLTMREAARRASVRDGEAWDLLDVRTGRLRDVEERARLAVVPAAAWIEPRDREPSMVVGPVLSLAATLASPAPTPSTSCRPTMVSSHGAGVPASALLYRQP